MGDIKFNQGFNGCSERMSILKNQVVPRDLSEFDDLEATSESEKLEDAYVYVRKNGSDFKLELDDLSFTVTMLEDLLRELDGYDSTKTQSLKHDDEGLISWVDDEESSEEM